jgi:hypothetical protein
VSDRLSPLVLTFDPDRGYIQSAPKLGTEPMLWQQDLEKVFSVMLSVFLRPKVMHALSQVIDERQEVWMDVGSYPPVADLSVRWACHFINSLPESIPDPEVGAGPNGEVSFDWYDGRDHILSVGLQPDGTMNYAYVSGNDRAHATRNLEKGLPDSLLGMLGSFKVEEAEHATR